MHSVWVSWLDSGEHWGWYVNLQEPFRRAGNTLETMDLALDVLVEPDTCSWEWKDEDEFQELIDRDLISAGYARSIRDEAERVIRRAEAGEPPFCDAWPSWRPDPSWSLPRLPDGWDRVAEREQED
jgi:hypothetical protein